MPWKDTNEVVVLPRGAAGSLEDLATMEDDTLVGPEPGTYFGADFFRLDEGVFQPPSFGPVPENYRLGVGDELIVDVWGDVEFRLTRVVDRDGTVILPSVGRRSPQISSRTVVLPQPVWPISTV